MGAKMIRSESGRGVRHAGGRRRRIPPDVRRDLEDDVTRWRLDPDGAGSVTVGDRLRDAGLEFPPAGALGDEEISVRLRQLLEALSGLRVPVGRAGSKSERERYDDLVRSVLDAPVGRPG